MSSSTRRWLYLALAVLLTAIVLFPVYWMFVTSILPSRMVLSRDPPLIPPLDAASFASYFEVFHKAKSVKFHHLGKVTKPFQILKGGYQIIFKNGKWSQVYGSEQKKQRFKKEDRRGHRSELRKEGKLKTADPKKIAKSADAVVKANGKKAKPAPASKVSPAKARTLESVSLR